jgi:hypothetical protein
MESYSVTRTQFKVADFLGWQRAGQLDLSPAFQRRSVWKPGAKSLLIDTVVRNLPTPIIFLRDRIELDSLSNRREVVDGQQRLRTLIAYVAPEALPDYDEERDSFTVRRTHNAELAGKSFNQLDDDIQRRILDYEFSTHVLPSLDDRDILLLFARLNATGERLSPQELRNAAWFGECKTLMYSLAVEQLERWRNWGVFNGDDLARMKEVELTSDMTLSMLEGFGAKSQPRLDAYYRDYDDSFPEGDEIARRFRKTMDVIDATIGEALPGTIFSREIWFQPLFYLYYETVFGSADLQKAPKPKTFPSRHVDDLIAASAQIRSDDDMPEEVAKALRGASTDARSRQTRLGYLEDALS